jgi:hypothetical protein
MLTDEGLEAWNAFSKKTHAVVVTRAMPDSEIERLDVMLLDWKAEPTEQKEQAIISKFAIKGERNGPEPGDDY